MRKFKVLIPGVGLVTIIGTQEEVVEWAQKNKVEVKELS